ncbi:bifunctional diguanylate cyclase/phosphodiesterase [Chitinimonas lacunae]|uniref:EAL domain-containing protein n=1 Tax=Chitinimonas lacunae TaxID=1963018 RepID=A0ABV8MKE1_9NEIS
MEELPVPTINRRYAGLICLAYGAVTGLGNLVFGPAGGHRYGWAFIAITAVALYSLLRTSPAPADPAHSRPIRQLYRLQVLFLLTTLALYAGAMLSCQQLSDSLRAEVERSLQTTATLQDNSFRRWLLERSQDARTLLDLGNLGDSARRLLRQPGQHDALSKLQLTGMAALHDFERITLFDAQGRHVADSAAAVQPGQRSEEVSGLLNRRPDWLSHDQIHIEVSDQGIDLYLPLHNLDNQLLGLLRWRVQRKELPLQLDPLQPADSLPIMLSLWYRDNERALQFDHQGIYPVSDPQQLGWQATRQPAPLGLLHGLDHHGSPAYAMARTGSDRWTILARIPAASFEGPQARIGFAAFALASVLALCFAWLIHMIVRQQYLAAAYRERLEAAAARRQSDFLSRYVNDAVLLIDAHGRIQEVNERAETLYGLSRQQLCGQPITELFVGEPPLDAADGQPVETLQRRGDGGIFPVELRRCRLDDSGKSVLAIRDISEQQRTADRLARTAALLRLLSRVNQAILRVESPAALFNIVCETIGSQTALALAWIADVERGFEPSRPNLQHSSAADLSRAILATVSGHSAGLSGPVERVRQSGRYYLCNDVALDPEAEAWRPFAERFQVRSIAAFPLLRDGKLVAVLALYADQPQLFDAELVDLLNELADDIGFALASYQRADRLRLANQIFEHALEAIMVTDLDGRIEWVNPMFTRITGYSLEEVVGQTPHILHSGRQDKDFFREMWRHLLAEDQWRGEIWNRRKNGELFAEWLTITAVRNEQGELEHYVAIFDDITERKAARDHIERLAHYDALTGLPNRLLLTNRLEQTISMAERQGDMVAVMFLDLDRFKYINDTLGHAVGDSLLSQVAKRLSHCVRDSDTIARLGGDEFVLVLPGIRQPSDAAQVAAKVLTAVAQRYHIEGNELTITASIGISLYPADATDREALIKYADAALYRAKERGRNLYQFFTPDINASVTERLQLENDLRRALEQQELHLVYQPQVRLSDGRPVGVEALLRWHHREHGLISPARFIPVAEESGLIVEIGRYVMFEACKQARHWLDQGLRLRMAVNMSALQFLRDDPVQLVEQALTASRLPAELLEVEVTESAVLQDAERVIEVLKRLHRHGVMLAVDDFGTGYSSLSYLKRFAIDRLKIDQTFVRDLPHDNDDVALCRAIVSLAQSLSLTIIAEGVETLEQVEFLQQLGCQEAQGYHFGRPMAPEQLTEWMAAQKILES